MPDISIETKTKTQISVELDEDALAQIVSQWFQEQTGLECSVDVSFRCGDGYLYGATAKASVEGAPKLPTTLNP